MTESSYISSFERLRTYCEANDYKGFDPFDGLNSRLFQSIPFVRQNRLARLAWLQCFKRSPLDFRKLTGVPAGHNPKALGLFIGGYLTRYETLGREEDLSKALALADLLLDLRSTGYSGDCWGYNFDWQAKAFFQPAYTPTVVASSFIARAMLKIYEHTGDTQYLQSARRTCTFILTDLNRTYFAEDRFAFSYSPLDRSVVFNASLLGADILTRVYAKTGERSLLEPAIQAVSYCCEQQQADGSWAYGTYAFHQWIDSFHTGYNLECIHSFMRHADDFRFQKTLEKGFDYYIRTFFTPNGQSKYYNNALYPIDVHAPTQLVFTLHELGNTANHRALLENVLDWTIRHMQSNHGYFYYRINRWHTNKIPYMRWSQAWMFYALAVHLKTISNQ